jgi:hypothetical protein
MRAAARAAAAPALDLDRRRRRRHVRARRCCDCMPHDHDVHGNSAAKYWSKSGSLRPTVGRDGTRPHHQHAVLLAGLMGARQLASGSSANLSLCPGCLIDE